MMDVDISRDAATNDWRDRCYSDYSYYDTPDSNASTARRVENYTKSLALTTIRGPSRILEVGFGEGHFLDWACQHGHQTQGVDVIPSLVEGVRAKGHEVLLGTIADLPPSNNSLDLIVAFHVFEHLYPEELLDTLELAFQMLRPGGQILIEVPNAATPFSHRLVYASMTHVAYLTTNSVKQFGRAVGFKCHFEGNSPRIYSAIYNNGGRLPLDPTVTIVLEKPN